MIGGVELFALGYAALALAHGGGGEQSEHDDEGADAEVTAFGGAEVGARRHAECYAEHGEHDAEGLRLGDGVEPGHGVVEADEAEGGGEAEEGAEEDEADGKGVEKPAPGQ